MTWPPPVSPPHCSFPLSPHSGFEGLLSFPSTRRVLSFRGPHTFSPLCLGVLPSHPPASLPPMCLLALPVLIISASTSLSLVPRLDWVPHSCAPPAFYFTSIKTLIPGPGTEPAGLLQLTGKRQGVWVRLKAAKKPKKSGLDDKDT